MKEMVAAGVVVVLMTLAPLSGTGRAGPRMAVADDFMGEFADSEPGRHACCHALLPEEVSELAGVDVDLTSGAGEIDVDCATGDHTRVSGPSHGFGGFDYADWDITLESWLRHPEESPLIDRGFRCAYTSGVFTCAGLGGNFRPIGGEFRHKCFAYDATPDALELYLRQGGLPRDHLEDARPPFSTLPAPFLSLGDWADAAKARGPGFRRSSGCESFYECGICRQAVGAGHPWRCET